jgi:hypothetical protein
MGHRLQPGRLKEGFWSRERGTPSRLLVAFPPLSSQSCAGGSERTEPDFSTLARPGWEDDIQVYGERKHAIAKRKTAGRLRGHADGAVSFGVLFFPLCPPEAVRGDQSALNQISQR